ncbi:MAG: hypothetical protein J7578_17795 [Chitinophagaceae bacterium]|nr:hypothetical protein [Chitinophagaceae bacterium]
MKEVNSISVKYIVILIIVLLIGVAIAFLYLRKNYLLHKNEINDLISKEVNGQINILKNKNRGSYNLRIGNYEINSLPIAYEVEKYNIQLGDSVRKEANSRIMIFYKNINGVFEKNCEYKILP